MSLNKAFRYQREKDLQMPEVNDATNQDKASLPILIIIALIVSLFGQIGFTSSAFAQNQDGPYNCGDRLNNHCYGTVFWAGTTNGVRTSIFTNQMFSPDCHVNNEVWLSRSDPAGIGVQWIEAGIKVDTNYSGSGSQNMLFWDDVDFLNRSTRTHYGPYFVTNDYGKYANVQIQKVNANTFSITISGLPSASINAETSDNDNYTPNTIQMGMELCGTNGAYAPKNGFTNNQYLDAHNGNWYYQSLPGVLSGVRFPNEGGAPAQGIWTSLPKGSSNRGGLFSTCTNTVINC